MTTVNRSLRPGARICGLLRLLILLIAAAAAAPAAPQDAEALRARYAALRPQLSHSDFGRPLALESSRASDSSKGDVYAVIDERFAAAGPALQRSEHWCEILILHLNIKQCRVAPAGDALAVAIGRKHDQPIEETYSVVFRYTVRAAGADYLRLDLDAASGPFGTRDYRIALEAMPVDAARTFVHMAYSYEYGLAARIALESYLQTLGRGKVGFTVESRGADGRPAYVGGLRGVIERNAMRYFLAIEAYLGSLKAPAPEQAEKRLRDWYAQTERYPQLYELERGQYLEMKRREIARQASGG